MVETVGALRPHLRSVGPGGSRRSGVGDGEVWQRPSGDLRRLGKARIVANREKRKLAEQYPAEPAPDIDFVLGAVTRIVPNGGILARFPGLYIPIIDLSFDGPEPTDTPFDTDVINRQYDGVADFPLYPLNLVADLNAFLGVLYVHLYAFDVSLPPDPPDIAAYQGTHGDSSYYFFETQDLPLFGPLRTLGVPEPLIDVVEPFFRVIVELGYDRSIPPWEPTPARLIPHTQPGDGDRRSRQRDRRGYQQRRGPHRLATAVEHSRGAARNHNSRRLEPDPNAAAGHPNRRDDNEAAGHRHRPDGKRQQVTGTESRAPKPTARQHGSGTDQTRTRLRHRPEDNAHRFDIRAVEACRSTRDVAPCGARFAWGVWPTDARTAALRRYRRANHPDPGCRG